MNALRFRPAARRSTKRSRRQRPGRGLSRRRHQSRRSHEGRRHAAAARSSISAACQGSTASRLCPTAACASARWCATPIWRRRTLASAFRLLAEALLSGASAQLRNAATLGGNLMQRTRCAYFFDAAERLQQARAGRRLRRAAAANPDCTAILGGASLRRHPPVRPLPCRWSRSTRWWRSQGRAGRREVAARGFPSPARRRRRSARPSLDAGELIVAVRLPPAAAASPAIRRYLKVRDRISYAFALVSAAAALRLEGGLIVEARLALGGVAPKPWRAREAEASLTGARPGTEAFRRAADAGAGRCAARPATTPSRSSSRAGSSARALTLAAAGTPERVPALPASPFGAARHDRHRPHARSRPRPPRLQHRPAADPARRPAQGDGPRAPTPPTITRRACSTPCWRRAASRAAASPPSTSRRRRRIRASSR